MECKNLYRSIELSSIRFPVTTFSRGNIKRFFVVAQAERQVETGIEKLTGKRRPPAKTVDNPWRKDNTAAARIGNSDSPQADKDVPCTHTMYYQRLAGISGNSSLLHESLLLYSRIRTAQKIDSRLTYSHHTTVGGSSDKRATLAVA